MDASLKQQFQALEEQQQKKLKRIKQRQEEKNKRKEEVAGEKSGKEEKENGFGVSDDLGLVTSGSPTSKEDLNYNEDVINYLNDQIREIKDENGRLYKLLSERDYEIRRLKKQREEDRLAMTGGGLGSETAATKIVDLSKKNRELAAEAATEKTKVRQLTRRIKDLEKEINSSLPSQKTSEGGRQPPSRHSTAEDLEDKSAEIRSLQERLGAATGRLSESRNQAQQLRLELKVAHKVLGQELGDSAPNFQALLAQGGAGASWRGRAQQILTLQKKVSDLKAQLGRQEASRTGRPATEMSLEDQFMTMGVGGGTSPTLASTPGGRQLGHLRQLEKERRESQQKASEERKALEEDYGRLKEKHDAARARNKVLSNEMKSLKQQMATLVEKGNHDDELVTALMKQLGQMKEMMESNSVLQQQAQSQQEQQVRALQSRSQQETGVVEQLKKIVGEKEQKVKALQQELLQLKTNINRERPSSAAEIERPSSSRAGRQHSVLSAADLRPPTADLMTPSPPQSRQSARSSSRQSLEVAPSPPRPMTHTLVGGQGSQDEGAAVERLRLQAQEHQSLYKAAEVERDKLLELVSVLQHRLDESSTKTADMEGSLQEVKRRNVQLEKQLGKARLESAPPSLGPGGAKRAARTAPKLNANAPSLNAGGDESLLRDDLVPSQENLAELQTRLVIQMDENQALKAALQSTMRAKEEDLKLYHDMMRQTKQVFLQGLRQYRQQPPHPNTT